MRIIADGGAAPVTIFGDDDAVRRDDVNGW